MHPASVSESSGLLTQEHGRDRDSSHAARARAPPTRPPREGKPLLFRTSPTVSPAGASSGACRHVLRSIQIARGDDGDENVQSLVQETRARERERVAEKPPKNAIARAGPPCVKHGA